MQQSIYTDTWLQSVLLYGFLFSFAHCGKVKGQPRFGSSWSSLSGLRTSQQGLLGQRLENEFQVEGCAAEAPPTVTPTYMHVIIVHISKWDTHWLQLVSVVVRHINVILNISYCRLNLTGWLWESSYCICTSSP